MMVIDPLSSSYDATGQPHNLMHLKEFGAERDHITLYFLMCNGCAAQEEVFLRTTHDNVNRILSQVQATLEYALGDTQVERMPSSKCSYLVRHRCQATPPVTRRLPNTPVSGRQQPQPPPRPKLPSDLQADITSEKRRLPPQRQKSTLPKPPEYQSGWQNPHPPQPSPQPKRGSGASTPSVHSTYYMNE